MLRKIILGGLLVALVGILIAGAVNRTASPRAGTSGNQRGRTTQGVTTHGGRNSADSDGGNVAATGEANVTEWHTVPGSGPSVDANRMEITASDGHIVEASGRVWQLAAAQNFTAFAGD